MSDPWLTFDPVLPLYLTLAIAMATGVLLVLQARAANHRFMALRITAALVITVALGGLLLRPSYPATHSGKVLLITPGYASVQVDSILRLYPGTKVIHTPDAKPYKNSTALTTYHALRESAGDLQFILGNGLPSHALELIKTKNYRHIPSTLSPGITHIRVAEPVFSGRENIIEGTLKGTSAKTTLYLAGPGGKEDSVVLRAKPHQPFSLSFTPKQPGNFVYTITQRDSLGHEEVQELPVNVMEKQKLDILFLLSFPTFEVQYLKNFLASDQHRLTLRYQLSKNTYRHEYANMASRPIGRVTEESLRPYHLLFLDTDILKTLSKAEKSALQEAIQSGRGLIILFNEAPSQIRQLTSLVPMTMRRHAADTAILRLSSEQITLPAWPMAIAQEAHVLPVLKNRERTLSAYAHRGFGKVGLHILQETYRLMLAGDSSSYNTLWSSLIEKTARSAEKKYHLEITTPFPFYQDEPIDVRIIAFDEDPSLEMDSVRIPLIEDVAVDGVWYGRCWAGQPGWHILTIPQDSTRLPYYVSPGGAWKTIRSANLREQTQAAQRRENIKGTLTEKPEKISPFIFFVAILISAGFLWLAPKL
jgi:hypothetical protein